MEKKLVFQQETHSVNQNKPCTSAISVPIFAQCFLLSWALLSTLSRITLLPRWVPQTTIDFGGRYICVPVSQTGSCVPCSKCLLLRKQTSQRWIYKRSEGPILWSGYTGVGQGPVEVKASHSAFWRWPKVFMGICPTVSSSLPNTQHHNRCGRFRFGCRGPQAAIDSAKWAFTIRNLRHWLLYLIL